MTTPSLQLKEYDNPQAFYDELSEGLHYLADNLAKNHTLLAMSRFAIKRPEICLYKVALFDTSFPTTKLVAAAIVFTKGSELEIIPSPLAAVSHAEQIYAGLQSQNIKPTKYFGGLETAKIYEKASNGKITPTCDMGLYRCRKVIRPSQIAPQTVLRLALEKDIDTLIKWSRGYCIEALHFQPTPTDDAIKANLIRETEQKRKYVLEVNGQIVSMANSQRDVGSSISIGGVFTPKNERSKGYGSTIVALLTEGLLSDHQEVNLFTDLSNSTSNKIYLNVGYEHVCNWVDGVWKY